MTVFRRGDAIDIAHKCTVQTIGEHVKAPLDTLAKYGVKTGAQLSTIRASILTDERIGIPSYDRGIDANALKDMSFDWTISQISILIYDNSYSLAESRAYSHRTGSRGLPVPEKLPAERNILSGIPTASNLIFLTLGFTAGLIVSDLLGSRWNKRQ